MALAAFDAKAVFDQAEISAERLVARLRMVISFSLGIVFLVAVYGGRQQIDPDVLPTLQRQWAMAGAIMTAYFLLGLISFLANQRGAYKPWIAWIAVTGDCIFLLANIWFGVTNLQMPGAYLATLPPIWLTPVVLAFGALRFNPLLQGFVTAFLLAGLVVIGLIAPSTDPPRPADVALFFGQPPNVMRLAMLALAGAVLGVACLRARRLLSQSIDNARRQFNLTRYLPTVIADRLAEGGLDELRRGKRRKVAVLFVDIRDFTARAERMPPEELSAFLSEFRRRVGQSVAANRGVIDKFIGDAAMAVFGLNDDGRKAARNALACGRSLIDDMQAWDAESDPVRIGVGVHYGAAFCGAIGGDDRLEFTVLGDVVNVASRLEAMTKDARRPLIVSAETLEAAGVSPDGDGWNALGPTQLRGRSEPLALFGFGS